MNIRYSVHNYYNIGYIIIVVYDKTSRARARAYV